MDLPKRPRAAREASERTQKPSLDSRFTRGRPRALPFAWGVYLALAIAVLASIAVTVALERTEAVQRYGPNFTTELLGIIVTLAFVQRLLAREERARKLRASVGPLRKSRRALGDFVDGWSALLRGAFDTRRTELPRSFEQLLASDYTGDLASLDPQGGPEEGEPWTQVGVRELVRAQRGLREVIAVYSASLDPDYLEAIDELADDSFVQFIEQLAARNPSAREWRVAINQSKGHREGHFVRLLHALTVHNSLAREAARFRSSHLMPTSHSLPFQLAADHDLAVPLRLGSGWWEATPRAGELRSV